MPIAEPEPEMDEFAPEAEDVRRCPDCRGLVDDDGYTTDPHVCCFWCRAD